MGSNNAEKVENHQPLPNHKQKKAHGVVTDQGLAGAIGGCATRFFCQPFDVLKIRFQVSVLYVLNETS